jgi:hypothetical protein
LFLGLIKDIEVRHDAKCDSNNNFINQAVFNYSYHHCSYNNSKSKKLTIIFILKPN